MKKLFIILLLFPAILKAQNFKVTCGNDTTFCYGMYGYDTTSHIGTQVKIFNGVPPFTYKWSCYTTLGSPPELFFTASAFLNDTNLLNPYIIDFIHGSYIKFTLTVTDSIGEITSDTLNVRYSSYAYLTEECSNAEVLNINVGDSVQFEVKVCGVGRGFPPYRYLWTPTLGLSDSTISNPWCKPLISNIYYNYVIDTTGCKSLNFLGYNISVNPSSIKSINDTLDENIMYPNPAKNKISIESLDENNSNTVEIFDISGQVVFNQTIQKDNSIDISNLASGIYIVKVSNGSVVVVSKLIKE